MPVGSAAAAPGRSDQSRNDLNHVRPVFNRTLTESRNNKNKSAKQKSAGWIGRTIDNGGWQRADERWEREKKWTVRDGNEITTNRPSKRWRGHLNQPHRSLQQSVLVCVGFQSLIPHTYLTGWWWAFRQVLSLHFFFIFSPLSSLFGRRLIESSRTPSGGWHTFSKISIWSVRKMFRTSETKWAAM